MLPGGRFDDVEPSPLRLSVLTAYSSVAESPNEKHPFPVGRLFAAAIGYPEQFLDTVPASADAYAGLSNVSVSAPLKPGQRVLDLGCGAGLDSLIAAQRVGGTGLVAGLDFSPAMLQRARYSKADLSLSHLFFVHSGAETMPFADGAFDVALVNGIFNLNPAREAIFRELARVVRPGGVVFGVELVLQAPLTAEEKAKPANWFA